MSTEQHINGDDKDINEQETGTKHKRCSKCRRPCSGHIGPYGPRCSAKPADESADIDADDDDVDEQPEASAVRHEASRNGHDQLFAQLISQMSALNTNMTAMITEQKYIRETLTRDATRPPATSQSVNPVIQQVDPGINTPSYTALPGGARILDKTAKAALKGEYVNLVDFLPISDLGHRHFFWIIIL